MMESDPTKAAARPHILIVDDLPANLSVLQGVLGGAGFRVLTATSGERALSRLAHIRPDLILLDVNMPGLDGYATCRQLKADARWREVPVLFLTALDDPADKLRGFEAGGVDYITKPIHAEEVLARVRAHLQIRSLQQALAEQNALLQTAMARRLEAEAQLQRLLDRAVLMADADGQVEFCAQPARQLLERYFPCHDDPATLPPPLAGWLAGGSPVGRWSMERVESRLEVRRFAPGNPGAYLVLVLEEKPTDEHAHALARLARMGLTPSETKVLYWAAQGKSNQEVALILGNSLNTIKTHVASVIDKLGVETRLMAALRATEVLNLKADSSEKLLASQEKD